MSTGDKLLKAIFEVGLAVDTIDQITEVEVEDLPSGALHLVAVETGDWWRRMEAMHQKLHGEYDIPMNGDYCGEDPRVKYGLADTPE